ncbi:MAG: transporter substrate-binding domain-containing protein [Candidatus Thiodiazotropha sp. (ex Codakia rugifera)]|nr:transporter substrate-binding domain-containing protein [Candidatus Thiodiazotropha sp. (ex Codakia rugifera)]
MLYRSLGLCLLGLVITTQAVAQVPRFSLAEKRWLEEHRYLNVGVVEMTPPILYFETAQPKGLAADYLRALASELGLQLNLVQYPDQPALLQALHEREIDLIGAAISTSPSSNELHFSRPYLNLPAALFAMGKVADRGLTALDGLEVSVVAGGVWEAGLPHLMPTLNIMAFNSLEQALRAVVDDRAQAFLGNVASVDHLVDTSGRYAGLEEMMRLDLTVDVALATLSTEPVLLSLLQKGLDRLGEEDMREIWFNWQGVEAPVERDSTILSVVIWGLLLALWSALLIWVVRRQSNRKLEHHRFKTRRSIKRLRRRENLLKQKLMALKHKTKRYRYRTKELRNQIDFMNHILPTASWSWDPVLNTCRWDDVMFDLTGRERGTFTPSPKAVLNLIDEQDRSQVAMLFDDQFRDEIRITYRILLPDGSEKRLLDYSHYVIDGEDESGKRVGICWDVDGYFNQIVQHQASAEDNTSSASEKLGRVTE